jgi:uncharacterized membrane protein
MEDWSDSIDVAAGAQPVFDFVSDVGNLPKYLPTTRSAQSQGRDRVRVQGEADGHRYDADGRFEVDAGRRQLRWSSDGEHAYAGELEVQEAGDERSRVTVRIHFELAPEEAQRFDSQGGHDHVMRDGIRKALESIRKQCEGKGGKVEPPQARS